MERATECVRHSWTLCDRPAPEVPPLDGGLPPPVSGVRLRPRDEEPPVRGHQRGPRRVRPGLRRPRAGETAGGGQGLEGDSVALSVRRLGLPSTVRFERFGSSLERLGPKDVWAVFSMVFDGVLDNVLG